MIYLAGPFFTQEQAIVIRKVEAILENCGCKCFSPSRDQPQLSAEASPEARLEHAKRIFDGNTAALDDCDTVLACIDDFDPGTIWEMGYAYMLSCLQLGTPNIIAFTTQHHGLNIMLSESCDGILQGYGMIERYFKGDLDVCKKWKGEVI